MDRLNLLYEGILVRSFRASVITVTIVIIVVDLSVIKKKNSDGHNKVMSKPAFRSQSRSKFTRKERLDDSSIESNSLKENN